jgi:putative SOS response-associated peptidase YedK
MEWEAYQTYYGFVGGLIAQGTTLPWYNQAPGQPSPVIVLNQGVLEHRVMRWGFPPMWVASRGKDPWKERPMVNAKSEQARTKKTWAKPLAQRRCLVPSTGFYEWIRKGKQKYPLHFRPVGQVCMTFGGIWRSYGKETPQKEVFAILTTGPNALMEPVHNRMPVVLDRADWESWLDPDSSDETVDALCFPAPAGVMEAVEVNTAVNGWKAFGADVLEANWSRADL